MLFSEEREEGPNPSTPLVGESLDPALFAPTGDVYSYFQVMLL
jgi:hypothetical protein